MSPIADAEFEIFYDDNSSGRGVPGPSVWEMKFAVRVEGGDVGKWTSGLVEVKGFGGDLSWGMGLIEGKVGWDVGARSRVFKREGDKVIVAVFEEAGVVLKYISSEVILD